MVAYKKSKNLTECWKIFDMIQKDDKLNKKKDMIFYSSFIALTSLVIFIYRIHLKLIFNLFRLKNVKRLKC